MRIFSPIFVSFSNLVLSIHMHWLFWRESTYSNILCIPVVNLFACTCTCTEGLIITSLGHRGLTYAIFLATRHVRWVWLKVHTYTTQVRTQESTAHVLREPTCICSFCIPCGVVINERAKGHWLRNLLASSRQLSCPLLRKIIKCGIAVAAGA
jgi:hypothetical protein